jgi:hypothetical protein
MLVRVEADFMGSLVLTPVSERIAKKFASHLRMFCPGADGSAYLQREDDINLFLSALPRSTANHIRSGWRAKIRMDPWEFGTYLGYDACNVEI